MRHLKQSFNQKRQGTFVISLDFELYWGVHDVFNKQTYADHIRGGRLAVPALLELFRAYAIHATWAFVGMMNCKNQAEWEATSPRHLPNYDNASLSAYQHVKNQPIQTDEADLYFAPELIWSIANTAGQELASHTFSHYYCLEKGQSQEAFIADAIAFSRAMRPIMTPIRSIVFPRNQVNDTYLSMCWELGLDAYRGNEAGWVYQIVGNDRRHFVKRALRLLDMYINLFGPQTFEQPVAIDQKPINIKGSRQLKPVSKRLHWLESRRLKRILNAMTYAAKKGEIYHLWWHPHNFGRNLEGNLAFLRRILNHYRKLNRIYGFQSASMGEVAASVLTSQVNEQHS